MEAGPSPDYEAEYDNRGRVPEHPAIFESWARDSLAWRTERPPETVRYGNSERTAVDLFQAGAGPVVAFIHGGYWQAMDRSLFSHMARGLNQRGVNVGVVGYELCPTVTLAEIVEQVRDACAALTRRTGERLVVAGHSAGGHLAACMLADPRAHVRVAYSISGLFDLRPLTETRLNGALRLSADEAERLSPLLQAPCPGSVLDAVVGEAESAEFHRQSRSMVEAWGAAGAATRYESLPGANHFTAIAPLADPGSAMVERLLELRGSA